jgi:UPF0755 protein
MLLTLAFRVTANVLNAPTPNFPLGEDITIEEGMTIEDVSVIFESQSLVRSSFFFYLTLIRDHGDRYVQAGSYTFTEPLTTAEIAEAIVSGQHQSPALKVTFPEGFRASRILEYLPDDFSESEVGEAITREGYLFPDTYYLSRDMTLGDILSRMEENYEDKITPYRDRIAASGLTEEEVIILASIIEREAKDEESMRLVAGVLLNRFNAGMPLQVDAAFDYLLDKESSELTLDDLAIDSPYNTYRNVGLTPTPISNPGLTAILAVLGPMETDYFYYLTANDGEFHYAKTFDEHKANKARYLR